jgi:hypothetical protein
MTLLFNGVDFLSTVFAKEKFSNRKLGILPSISAGDVDD